jgi:hypothetical protein
MKKILLLSLLLASFQLFAGLPDEDPAVKEVLEKFKIVTPLNVEDILDQAYQCLQYSTVKGEFQVSRITIPLKFVHTPEGLLFYFANAYAGLLEVLENDFISEDNNNNMTSYMAFRSYQHQIIGEWSNTPKIFPEGLGSSTPYLASKETQVQNFLVCNEWSI